VDRRTFVSALTFGLAATPLLAVAQQARTVRRIGYISSGSRWTEPWWQALVAGLQENGWVEHRNLIIDRRSAGLQNQTAIVAAEELVRLRVEVIVVTNIPVALAVKHTTTTVPIVIAVSADPVATGLVASLARPGGNVTGLSYVGTEVAGKQVELLKETIPGLLRVAVLANPTNVSHEPRTREIANVGRALKIASDVLEARTHGEIQAAFAAMAKRRPGAAIVLVDPLFHDETANVVRLAAEQRLPVMYGLRESVVAGGLMAYGANFPDMFRHAAIYVDKILKGTNPADLPVEQPTKFELVINLRTAKALGQTIPQSLLLRADQVIQ